MCSENLAPALYLTTLVVMPVSDFSLFALKVLVERSFRDSIRQRNGIDAEGTNPLRIEQFRGGRENAFSGLVRYPARYGVLVTALISS